MPVSSAVNVASMSSVAVRAIPRYGRWHCLMASIWSDLDCEKTCGSFRADFDGHCDLGMSRIPVSVTMADAPGRRDGEEVRVGSVGDVDGIGGVPNRMLERKHHRASSRCSAVCSVEVS